MFPFSLSSTVFRPLWARSAVFAALLAVLVHTAAGHAQDVPPAYRDKAPVNFQAEQISHDEKAQTVTALGDVEFVQGDRILRAEKMVYHLDTDTVEAIGNVSLLYDDGSIHFAEYVQLSKDMRQAFVQSLLSMLADNARFTAVEARRDGPKARMTEATYTPCRVCETDPHPTWQLKADEITHDEETKEIKYKNARLELLGVPLAWTPVFSHSDPSVKSRSGFLRPHFGWSTNLGAFGEGTYYYNVAPDKDATVSLRPTMRAGTLAQAEWRQRFESGRIKLRGSFAQSDRRNEDGSIDKDEARGSIAVEGLFDINEKWRAGLNVRRASDKEYLRLYDLDESDVLENEVYAERFSGRDYSRISMVNAQDLRLGLRPSQPEVLPLAEHYMMGEPQSLMGGRWAAEFSALDLQRTGSGQDMQRAIGRTSWERRDVYGDMGVATVWGLGMQGDAYAVQQNAAVGGSATTAVRGKVYADMVNSYPLVRGLDGGQAIVEPLLGFNVTSRVDNDRANFPDEDSRDVQIDPNSLFAPNRFPGQDRQEGGARTTYGLRSGLYGDDGRYGKVFVGQSYRFDASGNPFPAGSGMEGKLSDFVGQVSLGMGGLVDADYRVQLDRENLAAHRHEIRAMGTAGSLRFGTRYIYLDAIGGTGFVEPREQLQVGGRLQLTPNWNVTSGTLVDFGADPGVRRFSAGLGYSDDCFSFMAQGQRNLITEVSGESGVSIMLRVGLKNLGEFSSPEITLRQLPQQQE